MQELVVSAIVAVAGLYVLWYALPRRWRAPLGAINPKLAQAPGCGDCTQGCASCPSGERSPAAPAPSEQAVHWMQRPPKP